MPTNPSALDARSRAQALADVTAAEAALRLARAEHDGAVADKDLADTDLVRTRSLRKANNVGQAALDTAVREARAATAALHRAEAAIAMREAELASKRASLIGFDDSGPIDDRERGRAKAIAIHAPATGRVQ